MALKLNPGIVTAAFLNVVLLCGVPIFKDTDIEHFRPLLGMALVFPWLLYYVISRVVAAVRKDAREKRDRDDPADFV
ncbi:MAG: hypothetical protein GY838_16455 [bacterium]|nr:hypothetical protein [bacterium]